MKQTPKTVTDNCRKTGTKMNIFHAGVAKNWSKKSIYFQMANIGAEVGRAFS